MRQRIIRHRVDGWVDPSPAFCALFSTSRRAFWLDGGINAGSGMSFLGSGSALATASVKHDTVTIEPRGRVLRTTIFDFLRDQPAWDSRMTGGHAPDSAAVKSEAAVPIGWVGWLGYELRQQTTGIRASMSARHPDAALLFVDRLLAFDHSEQSVELVALGDSWTGELEQWRDATLEAIAAVRAPPDARSPARTPPSRLAPVWRDSDEAYLAKIGACQDAIREGEAYQLCLTTEVTVDTRPDPLATWLTLRELSPTHHGGFLRIGDVSLLSASPEQFLAVGRRGIVESKPIKGTRPRGVSPGDDDRLRAELESSDKERAENLMIVDLMRNDLGRVCEVGSVRVPSLLAVESYAQVHQLVSTVRGRLAAGRSPIDVVEACFPAGSMTGAPKLRATELLATLESRPRGLYSGAFGYFGIDGSIDLAMIIRSIVLDRDGATIGAGGGITALSVPAEELAEVKLKAAVLLSALGA